ncbi:hypothetical protein K438DRAFT_2017507 [Mycena galopus ATCC 62051]|nr:hypothetical protein K438DRAFT_2017507 [Mycena galopus ATCC 62051]
MPITTPLERDYITTVLSLEAELYHSREDRSDLRSIYPYTELGVTSASKPTQQQTKNFMMNAYSWMDSTGYVDRAWWFGCFESNNPPDAYATGLNAFFQNAGALNDLGYWYGYTSQPDRRAEDVKARHHVIAARLASPDAQDEDEDDSVLPNHCDTICELRNAVLEGYDYEEA